MSARPAAGILRDQPHRGTWCTGHPPPARATDGDWPRTGKRPAGHCLTAAVVLLPAALIVLAPAAIWLTLAAAVGTWLAWDERPRSEPLGGRRHTTPPEADWWPDRGEAAEPRRVHTRDLAESDVDGWTEGNR